jgi:hypothetical protein
VTSKNNRRQQKGVKREGKARKDSYFNQWWPMLQELQPADVDRSATCPDCGATFDGDCQTMPHEPSCPIYVAYEVASDEDRQWFREHPGEVERRRPPVLAEIQAFIGMHGLRLPDIDADKVYEPAGQVVVHYLSDGVRLRDFRNMVLWVHVRTPDVRSP